MQGAIAKAVSLARAPVLLLPGTLCDERLFAPLLPGLAERAADFVSLSGHRNVTDVARQVLRDAPAQFALLGFSLGGIVALEVAALAPGRVMGLALLGSTARALTLTQQAERRASAALAATMGWNAYVGETLWHDYVAPSSAHDKALRQLIIAMATAGGPVALRDQTELAVSRADSRRRLAALAMPALVLAGVEDAINPPKLQRELARGLPNAVLRLVPGAGHFVLLEQSGAVAREVAAWLARVDAAAQTARHRDTTRKHWEDV